MSAGETRVAFVVAGRIDQRTGGYLYDRAIVDGLRALGREVDVHELDGQLPQADAAAEAAAAACLDAAASADIRVIDGLALPAFAGLIDRLAHPWVALVHHPLALETGLGDAEAARLRALESELLRHPDAIVVTSPHTAHDLGPLGVEPGRVAVVPPGTAKPARPAREREGVPRRLLSVASVTPRKGFPVLLEALAQEAERDWTLAVAGSTERDADEFSRVRDLARRLGLERRVDFLGELPPEALADRYDEADLFVLASWHEGYGMAFAEALAHGLPIVATRAGAVAETVPASAGLLVAPGDATALAEALESMFVDPELYGLLASGAAAAGRTLADWPEAARRFADALDRVRAP